MKFEACVGHTPQRAHTFFGTGLAGIMRTEARQRQQGDYSFQYNVCGGSVPQVPAGALEVPQDRSQQVV